MTAALSASLLGLRSSASGQSGSAIPNLVAMDEGQYDPSAFASFSTSVEYSAGTARALAWLSQLAYEDEIEKVDRILGLWGLSRIAKEGTRRPLSAITDTRYLLAAGHGASFIAFAGTDPLSYGDWLKDLKTLTDPDGIHQGFKSAADTALGPISGEHKPRLLEQPSIFVTGHSLGAALAALTASSLHQSDDFKGMVAGVYLYGAPRVGRSDFASSYNSVLGMRTFRLVHGDDLVTRLPPVTLINGYRHVGAVLATGHHQKFDDRQPSTDISSNEPMLALSDALTALPSHLSGTLNVGDLSSGKLVSSLAKLFEALQSITVDEFIDALARHHPWKSEPGEESPRLHGRSLSHPELPSLIGDHLPDRYLYALTP